MGVIVEQTTNYRVASIIKLNGFGVSVIQRLCKTSVKKNLYWTIKDKVIEERFDGLKAIKRQAKVKVYGTDSNKEVRARLIEILYERVQYHKDKFIAPILLKEMQSMEVKKNGKVEHSSNSHDDQVFSYLHALYVWYDGQNLAERYGIIKNVLKTDEDEEMEEADYVDQLEKKEKLDTSTLEYDEDSDIQEALKFVEENNGITTTNDLTDRIHRNDSNVRAILLSTNRDARRSYALQTGVDERMLMSQEASIQTVSLPTYIFDNDFDKDLDYDDTGRNRQDGPAIMGNLSDLWFKV